jgi:phenylacetyl-CoA:acceptor oxidoreductase 26-kDa subunit
MSAFGPGPRLQPNWDWRAACNFMAGGAGSGLIVWSAFGGVRAAGMALGAVAVMAGLLAVWHEIGRPWRALNVLRHPRRSWMTREAMVAPLLIASALAAAWGVPGTAALAALAAVAFIYCQARILQAAKGIPAWREPRLLPLVVATALAEGGGAWMLLQSPHASAPLWAWGAFSALLLARLALWPMWRARLRSPAAAMAALDTAGRHVQAASLAALAAALLALLSPLDGGGLQLLQAVAGGFALAGGLWFKYTLVTRGAYTPGFTLPHLPVRGVPRRQEG